uniref:Uncharacterized protein n=1 Tax=Utricularia reniformis TaxID=192314 RepID=A0A1Y0B061_9LAMI|nr:hypothetical protein AEK19_MT0527 [Utricularia reniformis]ART30783.1 hypothetical protein AEK19_MT0527 [Utricularia reniformis]
MSQLFCRTSFLVKRKLSHSLSRAKTTGNQGRFINPILSIGNDCQRTPQKDFDYDPLATGFRPAQDGFEFYLLSSRYRKLDLFEQSPKLTTTGLASLVYFCQT